MNKIFIIIFVILFLSLSFATCKINPSGVVTGAACSIPKNDNKLPKEKKLNTENSDIKTKINNKKKRINFKLDRSLLYRNVSVIWFN